MPAVLAGAVRFPVDTTATLPIRATALHWGYLEGHLVLAERVGFEPTVHLRVHTLSKRAP